MTGPEFPPANTNMFSSAFTGSNTVATRRETVSGSVWSLPSPVFMARGSRCLIIRPVSSSNFGFQRQPVSRGWKCRIGVTANVRFGCRLNRRSCRKRSDERSARMISKRGFAPLIRTARTHHDRAAIRLLPDCMVCPCGGIDGVRGALSYSPSRDERQRRAEGRGEA